MTDEMNTCHNGHTTLRATWDCPICIAEMRADLSDLRAAVRRVSAAIKAERDTGQHCPLNTDGLGPGRLEEYLNACSETDEARTYLDRLVAGGKGEQDGEVS